VLIQMSKYEGFCWPLAEAAALGVACLCADEPILRETGPDGVFVPADLCCDWDSVADRLRRFPGSTSEGGSAAAAGHQRFTDAVGKLAVAAVELEAA
jgi:glycosyltransferase involved in cell wall biosynthesis